MLGSSPLSEFLSFLKYTRVLLSFHVCYMVVLSVMYCVLCNILCCSLRTLPADYFADNIFCHFCASMISGLVTTIASMPVDIAKTRFVHAVCYTVE